MNVLIEGVGNPVWGTLLPYLRPVADTLVGVDVSSLAFGLYIVDCGYLLPQYPESKYFAQAIQICRRKKVDLVVPTQGTGLFEWAKRKERLAHRGINVLISPP